LIEETAGITYKTGSAGQQKMDQTRQNLLRVGDIVSDQRSLTPAPGSQDRAP
jgi:hypothetical protein